MTEDEVAKLEALAERAEEAAERAAAIRRMVTSRCTAVSHDHGSSA